MNSTRPQFRLVPETTFLPAHVWNITRDTMLPMSGTPTDTRSRSCIRARGPYLRVHSGLHHRSDVAVLENPCFALCSSPNHGIHHGAAQLIGLNHLVWEQHPKRRIDHSQQAIAEVRFLARFHGVDVGGAEYVKTMEPGRQQHLLGLSFIACEGHPAAACLIGAHAAQK